MLKMNLFAAMMALGTAALAQTSTGFTQTRDGFATGDYQTSFTDTITIGAGQLPTTTLTVSYKVDVDEVDIVANDQVAVVVTVDIGPNSWTQLSGGGFQASITGPTTTFIDVQDLWTGDYDVGTVKRLFDPTTITSAGGVILPTVASLGVLQAVDPALTGSQVVVTSLGDLDGTGDSLVLFDLQGLFASDVDGRIQGTDYDLLQAVYDVGLGQDVAIGFLSPGHAAAFDIDLSDAFGTGSAFSLANVSILGLQVAGDRDDDSPSFDDEAGVTVTSSRVAFAAVPEPASLAMLGVGALGLLGFAVRRRPA
ncbi:PEP-CTERM sorting domain-containing protein [Paludisphaera soli]|uniref:PEP-CTERM sorting domain-containing protein n=1 Tax=Paludisphaera soli TaxID=2712865 RepID=UPI0013EB5943|nr:PEP-CTERM sorting domain-containing protein [Paludisphaera soli]